MNAEIVKRFLNRRVKLIKKDNYAIYGVIIDIEFDSVIFQSQQTTSAISLDCIAEITPQGE